MENTLTYSFYRIYFPTYTRSWRISRRPTGSGRNMMAR